MKLNSSKTRLRNSVLILGALAVAPLAAQAMVTEHESLRFENGSVLDVDQRSSAHSDSALARRFGSNSGVGSNGSALESLGASGEVPAENTGDANQLDGGHFNKLR